MDDAPRARRWLGLALAASLLQAAATVAFALLVSRSVAGVFIDAGDLDAVAPFIVAALVAAIVRVVAGLGAEVAAYHSARSVVRHARESVTRHIHQLGPARLADQRTGETAGLLVSGMEASHAYVSSYLPTRNEALAVPLLVLLVVLAVDPASVLVLLLTGPVLLLLLAVIGSRTRVISDRRLGELRYLSAFFLDVLRGLATLKRFGRSREQLDNLRSVGQSYSDATMDVLRTAFQTSLVLEWSAAIAMALVAVEVGLRLLAGAIDFDRALAVLIVTPEFFLPLRRLSAHYHEGGEGRAVAEGVVRILAIPVEDRVAAGPSTSLDAPAPGRLRPSVLRLEHVSLTYRDRDRAALDDVSLTLRRGEWLTIVGRTGAGKSTLVSVLLRFLEPGSGHITVDGEDLASIPVETWRASVAWVPQAPHLFHGSVLDNIRLGRGDASDEAVRAAAEAADASAFIERLPGRYDARLGEDGVRLSGGERQRIAIARALLRDAPILIFDEGTSHQDVQSEVAIGAALRSLAADRTVLAISHRLRLAHMADRVVVMADGRVVQEGRPAALTSRPGPFRELAERQLIEARST